MIFSKELTMTKESRLKIYNLQIFDINQSKTIYKTQISNKLMVGILKSGLYTLI